MECGWSVCCQVSLCRQCISSDIFGEQWVNYLFKAGYIGLFNDTKGYNDIRLECSSSLEMVARVLLIPVNEAPK